VTSLLIPARFNGPPGSANGGVTCGLLARATGASEVTLRLPPPLDVALRLEDRSLYDGDALVAEAGQGHVSLDPAPAVSVTDAAVAASRYAGLVDHPFPTCFVCGPDHPTGLHLFPGPVGPGVVAVPWTPADQDPVMVWAALDCPGGWSCDLPGRPMVLGRMALRVDAEPTAGEDHVVVGWKVGEEGRKVFTGSALYDGDGALLAIAQQTWITLS
jgi:hypothetical protein